MKKLLVLVVMVLGCDDGHDLIDLSKKAAPAYVVPGCEPLDANRTHGESDLRHDAGAPDADCSCPDGGDIVVLPGCGVICGLQ